MLNRPRVHYYLHVRIVTNLSDALLLDGRESIRDTKNTTPSNYLVHPYRLESAATYGERDAPHHRIYPNAPHTSPLRDQTLRGEYFPTAGSACA
jgi:hypothetical protein